jgi:uncharacterized protein (TIGR03437 family)
LTKSVFLVAFLPASLLAGTITLGTGTLSVLGGNADSTTPPAYVTNPNAFAFVLTDGITTVEGEQRRNTDPTGGPNKALEAVATFDGRQTTITGTIGTMTIADSEGAAGGHSQAFAIGLCTGGWRDQAAATYNLNLLASQPAPAKDGFSGIAFGYRNGSLYLNGYDYDSQPNQIFEDLGKAGLASGQSLSGPITFSIVYASGAMTVSLNGQSIGSVPTSHDFSSALAIAMGASVDPANGVGAMNFAKVVASTPTSTGTPALLYSISGNQQSAAVGMPLPLPLVVGVVDAYRNPVQAVLVSFAAGDATASPSTVLTDPFGHASTNIILGQTTGSANVIASVGTLPLLSFSFSVTSAAVTPVIGSVVDGAGFGPKISSGGWATILGNNLSNSTATVVPSGTSLPLGFAGVSASIDGKPAFVYYVSPSQINVIVPDDPTNGGVNVQVTTPAGTGNVTLADKEDFAPALFLFTSKYPAAAHADGTFLGPVNLLPGMPTLPAQPGEVILLFGTGFGPSSPVIAAGQLATGDAQPAQSVTATVGGMPAQVQGYLISPGMYQFNLTVPSGLPVGDAPISLTVLNVTTQSGLMLSIGGSS